MSGSVDDIMEAGRNVAGCFNVEVRPIEGYSGGEIGPVVDSPSCQKIKIRSIHSQTVAVS